MKQEIPPLGEQQEREFREAIARAVAEALAAQSQDVPEDKYPLEWSLEFWRTVYGATQEEAETVLAALLKERGQHEK